MTDNPYLKREQRAAKRPPAYWRSKKQEKEVAEKLGARLTIASGSQRQKGDVVHFGVMRVECKTTCARTYRLTKKDIKKIINASRPNGEVPAMIIEFHDSEDEENQFFGKTKLDVALISVADLKRFIELLREENKDERITRGT